MQVNEVTEALFFSDLHARTGYGAPHDVPERIPYAIMEPIFSFIRLCHRNVLAALRGAYGFASAQAAIFIAAKVARVPHGPAAVVRRRRSLTNGDSRDKATCIHGCSLAPSSGYAAQRLRSANPFFRDLLMTLDRLRRYSLSLAFCAENTAALRALLHTALPYGGGSSSLLSIPVSLEDSANGNAARPSARPP